MADRPMSIRRGGSGPKIVIFISLYVLLLESLIEWVLVLYLYGNRQVDSKMSPSLVLILIASFFTVPLVTLHSLLAWQYNKVRGFGRQKKFLHTVCTYLLRLTIIVWVAASVAGLVVISQQISCLQNSLDGSFWKSGVSCALHRAAVIISVLSFITVCFYFCSRELCNRPYDVSLLGVYSQRQPNCDDSIFSQTSFESENSLKNDILYICRGPDVTCGTLGVDIPSSNDAFNEKHPIPPIIQHPSPIRPRSQLRLETDVRSESAEILSGTTLASPVSRTPTLSTLKDVSIPVPPFAELSAASEIQRALGHTRQKSSLSSLRKFLPKFLPFALPLSADPQIRALAEADCRRDIETQADGNILEQSPCASSISTLSEVTDSDARHSATQPTPARPRAASANSTDAPEVLVPAPVHVRRSNTAHTAPVSRPTSRSHRSSYMLIPPNQIARRPLNRAPSRRVSPIEPDTVPTHTQPSSRRRSEIYHFDPVQIPRHTQSQNNRPQRRFEQYRNISPNWRRNDVEILYPSTRRPRSSTCGGIGPAGHLDSIRETGTSVDEARVPNSEKMGRGNILDRNTYRGANRTSMHGFS